MFRALAGPSAAATISSGMPCVVSLPKYDSSAQAEGPLCALPKVRGRVGCPHQEARALHNSENDRRPAVVMRRRFVNNFAYRRLIVVLEPAAKSISQKLFGYRAGKLVGLLKQQRAQALKPFDLRAARRGPARIHRLARFVNRPPAS